MIFKKLRSKCDTPAKRILFILFIAAILLYLFVCISVIITGVAVPHLTLLGVIATPFIPAGLLISNIDWALNPFGSFEYFLGFATLVSTATIVLAPLCIQFDILGKVNNQLKRIKKWIATGK